MTFIILIVLSISRILIFRKCLSKYSVIVATLLIFGITTAVLLWGMVAIEKERIIHFFNSDISSDDFYYLMAAWYAADAVCTALIIRNHIAYMKINSQGDRKIPDRSER